MVTNASREEELFGRAIAIPTAASRAAFLATACGSDAALRARVEGLLSAADRMGDFLREPTARGPEPAADDRPEGTGSVVDRYELLECIGEGGGGRVFRARPLAEDLPPVALKVMRAGVESREAQARFKLERRALARMSHPGIARVFDAGVTASSRPYFAMEFVDGRPITAFADQHQLGVVARLELFREVCLAVHHAHQKGVIHRDIKPSNVMVSLVDGKAAAKVIDFGIAKEVEDAAEPLLTRHGMIVGTPQYMSPEQAGVDELDIDVRADIYSLGVVLFELLTGTTPLDPDALRRAPIDGMRALLNQTETPRPSRRLRQLAARDSIAAARGTNVASLSRFLQDDLDWVVLKAVDRDRERRYPSAWELAEDVRRCLRDEPVVAGPPSRVYRLRKFVRRNRLAVAGSAVVAIALVVAATGATLGLLSARSAQRELTDANDTLRRVVDFQRSRLAEIDPQAMGVAIRAALLDRVRASLDARGLSAEELDAGLAAIDDPLAAINFTSVADAVLERELFAPARRAIDRDFQDQVGPRASLLHTLAETMVEVGLDEAALDPARNALELRRAHLGDDHPATLNSVALLGTLLRRIGHLDEAAAYHEEALRGRQRVLGFDHVDTMNSRNSMAALCVAQQDWERADALSAELVTSAERVLGKDHEVTLRFVNNRATFQETSGQPEAAVRSYRRALEGLRMIHGEGDNSTLPVMSNLSRLLVEAGRLEEAESMARSALLGMRRAFGDDHPSTLAATNALGVIVYRIGRLDEALALFESAIDGLRRTRGSAYSETIGAIGNVGATLRMIGCYDESVARGAESVALARRSLPGGHWSIGVLLDQYARSLAAAQRFSDAESALLEGRRILADALGEDDPRTLVTTRALVDFYELWHAHDSSAEHDAEASRWQARLNLEEGTG